MIFTGIERYRNYMWGRRGETGYYTFCLLCVKGGGGGGGGSGHGSYSKLLVGPAMAPAVPLKILVLSLNDQMNKIH